MANITITHSSGWDDCDCCGSFDWETVKVESDGALILNHSGDGHLGGNTWYRWEDAVREVLTALGHTVEFIYNGDDE